ncbi:hypothetical protein ACQEVM_37545 [Streptomyces sp. CA-243310]|uniref:hypothetical protein n=1 Tax=Streptomyces sp. CA-243310 TaxID=3240056 RepID=UPI003D8DCF73
MSQYSPLVPLDPERTVVATLGPEGTDAHAEATRCFENVTLSPSFNAAMEVAYERGIHALVAAGFVERAGASGTVTDCWVDVHFRNLGRMELVHVWQSPTKEMCLATNGRALDVRAIRSIALHPATQVFADRLAPHAAREYVDAKPIAVRMAADGRVDGCIGSVDVARQAGLDIRETFAPTMVWCLYRRAPRSRTNHHEPTQNLPSRC